MQSDTRLAHWFIIYVATIVFFSIGAITTPNLSWYAALALPAWMLPPITIAIIWGVLLLLTVLSLSLFWDIHTRDRRFRTTIALYATNSLLILLWNFLFFGMHRLDLAFYASLVVGVSIVVLMLHLWRISKTAALLLTPYLLWLVFAMYVNHLLAVLN